jgi:hypothetical protein
MTTFYYLIKYQNDLKCLNSLIFCHIYFIFYYNLVNYKGIKMSKVMQVCQECGNSYYGDYCMKCYYDVDYNKSIKLVSFQLK